MAARSLALAEDHILEQPFTFEGDRAGLRAATALHPRPTALLCGTDILSFGACDEARHMGIEVPGQLAFYGIPDAKAARVALPMER
jgi:LacI family transcriptional regulator